MHGMFAITTVLACVAVAAAVTVKGSSTSRSNAAAVTRTSLA